MKNLTEHKRVVSVASGRTFFFTFSLPAKVFFYWAENAGKSCLELAACSAL
jgi:hypothetical protein